MYVIIDDSKIMREELEHELKILHSKNVVCYKNGQDFLKDYKENKIDPNIVFLDGTMADSIPARVVIKKIKEKNNNQIIVIYGGFQVKHILDWVELGATGFLPKPLDSESLQNIINRHT